MLALTYGLTNLGIVHTFISLIAVGTGAAMLIRDGLISPRSGLGRVYIICTVIVCLTGFGIFQHGGFGKPHALGIITLVTLGIAWYAAGRATTFGIPSKYVETIAYMSTFFFHIVPGITESATRLPYGSPLATGPEDPLVLKSIGFCFVLFLIGVVVQVRKLKKSAV